VNSRESVTVYLIYREFLPLVEQQTALSSAILKIHNVRPTCDEQLGLIGVYLQNSESLRKELYQLKLQNSGENDFWVFLKTKGPFVQVF
jgi:hypothetical protein